MKMEYVVFRNVGIYNSDVGELHRRKHTTNMKTIMTMMTMMMMIIIIRSRGI